MGSTILIRILISYLPFCSAILNNATCIVSHDIFWHPLVNPYVRMNIPRVGYTRLDIDSSFCHLCMTALYDAKPDWASPSLPYRIFTYTGRKQLLPWRSTNLCKYMLFIKQTKLTVRCDRLMCLHMYVCILSWVYNTVKLP